MKKATPLILSILVITLVLLGHQAARAAWFRSGANAYINVLNVCTDGVELIYAEKPPPPLPPLSINVVATNWIATVSPAPPTDTYFDESLTMPNPAVPITITLPGVGPVMMANHIQTSFLWHGGVTPLSAGQRVSLVANENQTGGWKIDVTVRNCTLASSPPPYDTTIVGQGGGGGLGQISPNACTSFSLPITRTGTVQDINVALRLQMDDTGVLDDLTASLRSPIGVSTPVTVTLFDQPPAAATAVAMGSYCAQYQGDPPNLLQVDPMASFVIDDESVFEFLNALAPYDATAMKPSDPGGLGQFAGVSSEGEWELNICNASASFGSLVCWYIEFGESESPAAFGKLSPANGATNQSTSGLSLSWGAAAGSTDYDVCIDGTDNNSCDSSWQSAGSAMSVGLSNVQLNTVYYWQVRANNAAGTTYADGGETAFWAFDTVTLVANDDIDNALNISASPYNNSQGTTGATTVFDDPSFACGPSHNGQGFHSVWYEYTAPADGELSVDTSGSDFDTVLAVWTGTRGSLQLESCNDDAAAGGLQSVLAMAVTANSHYFIEIVGFNDGAQGNLDLALTFTPGIRLFLPIIIGP